MSTHTLKIKITDQFLKGLADFGFDEQEVVEELAQLSTKVLRREIFDLVRSTGLFKPMVSEFRPKEENDKIMNDPEEAV